jgi:SWI/SNF-related matrix-associated actin-dependent regulator of chromatin subfamily A3
LKLRSEQDRRALSLNDLIEPSPVIESVFETTEDEGDEFAEEGATETPPKIEQLIHLLKLQLRGDKSLVFSQFTSYLRKVCIS